MGMLKTIQSTGPNITPRDKFSVLFLGAGIERDKLFALATFAWARVLDVSPFARSKMVSIPENPFAVYCDPDPLAIDFQHNGKRLSVPEAQRGRLLDRINQQTVPLEVTKRSAPQTCPARRLWEPSGRLGADGSLIVVLVAGAAEGEL